MTDHAGFLSPSGPFRGVRRSGQAKNRLPGTAELPLPALREKTGGSPTGVSPLPGEGSTEGSTR